MRVESKAFQNIYWANDTLVPFSSARTLYRWIEAHFESSRQELKTELAETASSVSISFDGWGANNHVAILAVILHWITQDFKRRSVTIEFTEMTGGKSGAGMCDIIYASMGKNFEKVTEEDTEEGIIEVTQKATGLDIAHKLLAVTGDNAGNNNTFCDYFIKWLRADGYEDSLYEDFNIPRCRFHGWDSRIHCIAHVIALVCDKIYSKLRGGTYKQAAELIEQTEFNGGVFTPKCTALSVYQKVRTIVLYIQASDERRCGWKNDWLIDW